MMENDGKGMGNLMGKRWNRGRMSGKIEFGKLTGKIPAGESEGSIKDFRTGSELKPRAFLAVKSERLSESAMSTIRRDILWDSRIWVK